eukprot:1244420-Pyramimonas_sp.AAC.1
MSKLGVWNAGESPKPIREMVCAAMAARSTISEVVPPMEGLLPSLPGDARCSTVSTAKKAPPITALNPAATPAPLPHARSAKPLDRCRSPHWGPQGRASCQYRG